MRMPLALASNAWNRRSISSRDAGRRGLMPSTRPMRASAAAAACASTSSAAAIVEPTAEAADGSGMPGRHHRLGRTWYFELRTLYPLLTIRLFVVPTLVDYAGDRRRSHEECAASDVNHTDVPRRRRGLAHGYGATDDPARRQCPAPMPNQTSTLRCPVLRCNKPDARLSLLT